MSEGTRLTTEGKDKLGCPGERNLLVEPEIVWEKIKDLKNKNEIGAPPSEHPMTGRVAVVGGPTVDPVVIAVDQGLDKAAIDSAKKTAAFWARVDREGPPADTFSELSVPELWAKMEQEIPVSAKKEQAIQHPATRAILQRVQALHGRPDGQEQIRSWRIPAKIIFQLQRVLFEASQFQLALLCGTTRGPGVVSESTAACRNQMQGVLKYAYEHAQQGAVRGGEVPEAVETVVSASVAGGPFG